MNSFTFLIKIAYQDEQRAKKSAFNSLKTDLRNATSALKAYDTQTASVHARLTQRINAHARAYNSLQTAMMRVPAGGRQWLRMQSAAQGHHAQWLAGTQNIQSYLRVRNSGRAPLAGNVSNIQNQMQTLAGGLSSIGESIYQLNKLGALADVGMKIAQLSLAISGLSTSVALFFDEIKGSISLLGVKILMPYMDAFAKLQQQLIPLMQLTGENETVTRSRIQSLADLPALDFMSSAQALLDLVVSDPKRNVDYAERSLKAIANAVFSSGGGPDRVDLVTLALKQMRAKGIVAGEEVTKQLSPNIPGIFQFMKEAFGTADTRELKQKGVSPDDFISKLIPWLEKTYPKLPDSPQTLIENLMDRLFYSKAEIGGGVWKVAQDGLKAIVDTLDQLIKTGILKEIGANLASLFELDNVQQMKDTIISIVAAISSFVKVMDSWKDSIVLAVKFIANMVSFLNTTVLTAPLVNFLIEWEAAFNAEAAKLRDRMKDFLGGTTDTKSGVGKRKGIDEYVNELKMERQRLVDQRDKYGRLNPFNPLEFGRNITERLRGSPKLQNLDDRIKEIDFKLLRYKYEKRHEDTLGIGKMIKDSIVGPSESGRAPFSSKEMYDARNKMEEFKVKADEIILGGNNARRYISPLDYMGRSGDQKPAIQVQVHGVSALNEGISQMIYDVATQLVRQGALQGAS